MLTGAVLYGIMLSGPATSAYNATAAQKGKITQTFTMISSAWWPGYIFSPAIGGYPLWSLMGAVVSSFAPRTSRGRWMSVAQTVSLLATFFAPYLKACYTIRGLTVLSSWQ